MSSSMDEKKFIMKKNSITHQILLAIKFFNKPTTLADLKELNPEYAQNGGFYRSIARLSAAGYIEVLDPKTWIITRSGIDFLYSYADSNRRKV